MTTRNDVRALKAGFAIRAFSAVEEQDEFAEDSLSDLMANLGHYAQIRLGMSASEVVRLCERAITAWKAESDHPHEAKLQVPRCKIVFLEQNDSLIL